MPYQYDGGLANPGGGGRFDFPLPSMVLPPNVAVATHQQQGNAGYIGAQPSLAVPEVICDLPDAIGDSYNVLGRLNHRAVTRVAGFAHVIGDIPPGLSVWPHGLGAVPDMYFAQHADLNNVVNSFIVYAVDAVNMYFESFEVINNISIAKYAWIYHSTWTPKDTSPALDAAVPFGAGGLLVPHGLSRAPDLIMPMKWQASGGAAPNGAIVVISVDGTNVHLASTAGAGADLGVRMFAQATFSVQD